MKPGSNQNELIDFPSDHIFKAIGDNRPGFALSIHKAVSSVIPVPLDALKARESGGGKYLSVSVVVRLENRQQLERIYHSLKQVEGVRYLL
ncbi:MAG TPA: DUF493 domain-containing protein [Desulfuromonadales bacterium]|nr:DUF493 domain-containing protein [Desulfuromonadales bacterium]